MVRKITIIYFEEELGQEKTLKQVYIKIMILLGETL